MAYEDTIGEPDKLGSIPANGPKLYTAADVDFLLKGKISRTTSLPAASQALVDTVYLLTEEQSDYTKMHFYKCILDNGSYKWKDLNAWRPCGDCTDIQAFRVNNGNAYIITWKNPNYIPDSAPSEPTISPDYVAVDEFDHTIVVRNYNHFPASPNDGVIIEIYGESEFSNSWVSITDENVDTTKSNVYYKLFPVGKYGTINTNLANNVRPHMPTWDELHELISHGESRLLIPRGTQLSMQHSVYGTLTFTVVGNFSDMMDDGYLDAVDCDISERVKPHDPSIRNCVLLKSTYALTGDMMQFDAEETNFGYTTDTVFQAGKTYYTHESNGYIVAAVNVGDTVPAETYFERHPNPQYRHGLNRWDLSGMRQWLNSADAAGNWWVKKHANDVKPDYADTIDGFLRGFTDSDFIASIIEIDNNTRVTASSAVVTGNSGEFYATTTDKVWFPDDNQVMDSGSWGFSSADRTVYQVGVEYKRVWWLRSPSSQDYDGNTYNMQSILPNASAGIANGRLASGTAFVVPCLAIG